VQSQSEAEVWKESSSIGRPKRIVLIRHAQSEGNVDETVYQVGFGSVSPHNTLLVRY
jgi:hypothetical protein